MQEWIIAMLVISVLLILRDMAKTILTGRMSKKEEIFPIGEDHPQKEKVERYAAAFVAQCARVKRLLEGDAAK